MFKIKKSVSDVSKFSRKLTKQKISYRDIGFKHENSIFKDSKYLKNEYKGFSFNEKYFFGDEIENNENPQKKTILDTGFLN